MAEAVKPRPIREVCDERGIKMVWVARQMGYSRSYFSQIITGTRHTPYMFWERVSVLLNVPIDRVRPTEETAAA